MKSKKNKNNTSGFNNTKDFNNCCNMYDDAKIPPCANFLGSYNPFIKDGKIIYRNYNRFYVFLTFIANPITIPTYNPLDATTYYSTLNGNIQIGLYYFIISLFINEIQKGNIKNYKDIKIHDDEKADGFIKKVLENNYEPESLFTPSLTYTISNSNAILPLINGNIIISPSNFYIILMLSRACDDFGMLYSDNAYVTPDYINYFLANMNFAYNC